MEREEYRKGWEGERKSFAQDKLIIIYIKNKCNIQSKIK